MTLYDLGTHFGEGLRKVLALHPNEIDEIYCFEPNPTINVHEKLADIKHPKLHILKKAVWDRYGTRDFKAQDQTGTGFGAGLDGYGSDGAHWNAGLVDTIDIVHTIEAYGKRCVVKCDVEGAEWRIISKLVQSPNAMSLIDTLYIEWHMQYANVELRDQITAELKRNNINVIEWE